MKELKFETEKGKFVIYDDVDNIGKHLPYDFLTKIGYLKNLTEEQASEIVDKVINDQHFQNYAFKNFNDRWVKTAKQSLISLLISKGINLFKNPYQDDWDELCTWGHGGFAKDGKTEYELYHEQAEKTFYNPYIFKIK